MVHRGRFSNNFQVRKFKIKTKTFSVFLLVLYFAKISQDFGTYQTVSDCEFNLPPLPPVVVL